MIVELILKRNYEVFVFEAVEVDLEGSSLGEWEWSVAFFASPSSMGQSVSHDTVLVKSRVEMQSNSIV